MQLPELNFEDTFDLQIKRDKDKFFIYDLVRKNWLLLTPEEWVRQHWVHYFHAVIGFLDFWKFSRNRLAGCS